MHLPTNFCCLHHKITLKDNNRAKTMMLCQMPNELVYSVLNEWIENLYSIGVLDSAVCNHSERNLFTELLFNNAHIFDCQNHNMPDFYLWISSRLVKLNSLHFSTSFTQNQLAPISSGICRSILKTNELRSIRMVYSKVLLLFLNTCTTVRSLNLSLSCGLSDIDLDSVLQMVKGLLHLTLTKCVDLTDKACLSIAKYCPDLETIDLTSCSGVESSHAIDALTAGCTKLTTIILPSDLVDDDVILSIAEHCSNLTHLDINGSEWVTDESLSVLVERCPLLQTLTANYCTALGDASIVKIAQNCPSLKNLNVIGIGITDAALFALARHCPLLERLLLIECAGISDEGVIAIAKGCRCLEEIFMDMCVVLTDLSVFALAKHCPYLKEVGLLDCELVTDFSLSDLLDRCKELRVVGAYRTQQLASTALKALQDAQCVVLSDEEDYQNNIQFGVRSKFGPQQDRDLRQVTYLTCAAGTVDMPFLRTAAYLCPNLLAITFERYDQLEDSHVLVVLTSCPLIESVALRWCPKLTGRCIEAVTELCPNLHQLDLELSCLKIVMENDQGNVVASVTQEVLFHNLAHTRGDQLRQLRLCCDSLHSASLAHIANYCTNLSSLCLSGAVLMDDSTLELIMNRLDKLTKLSVKNCPLLSTEMIARVKRRFPMCLI